MISHHHFFFILDLPKLHTIILNGKPTFIGYSERNDENSMNSQFCFNSTLVMKSKLK